MLLPSGVGGVGVSLWFWVRVTLALISYTLSCNVVSCFEARWGSASAWKETNEKNNKNVYLSLISLFQLLSLEILLQSYVIFSLSKHVFAFNGFLGGSVITLIILRHVLNGANILWAICGCYRRLYCFLLMGGWLASINEVQKVFWGIKFSFNDQHQTNLKNVSPCEMCFLMIG